MKHLALFFVVCLLAFDCRADDTGAKNARPQPKARETREFRYDGVWKPKAAMLRAVLLPPPTVAGITLTIENGEYEVTVEGEDHSDRGTFTLDTSTTPKRMTIKSTSGTNKGKTFLAIYEIKNANTMRVCYDLARKEFPKEFKAPKGTELYLVGYRRQQEQVGADLQFVIGNREEPTETQLLAIAKAFCVAMRRQHDQENVPALRGYFDPRYLEEHGLLRGDFNVRMACVGAIHNIQIAHDNRTLLCYVETASRQKEAIMLRSVVHDGKLFLLPLKSPDKKTNLVTPWILHRFDPFWKVFFAGGVLFLLTVTLMGPARRMQVPRPDSGAWLRFSLDKGGVICDSLREHERSEYSHGK